MHVGIAPESPIPPPLFQYLPPHAESSLWSKLGGWGTGREDAGKGLKLREGDDDTVHVFTVASGHMWVLRLLRLLCLLCHSGCSSP